MIICGYMRFAENEPEFIISKISNFYIHGDSIKCKPNCLCHIYLIPDHIILKLSRYLENSTNIMIPIHHNILFNR